MIDTDLPEMRTRSGNTPAYQNFSAGGCSILDNQDRLVISDPQQSHLRARPDPDGSQFQLVKDYDVTSVVDPAERMNSALPDFRVTSGSSSSRRARSARSIARPARSGTLRLGVGIQNSFTVDRNAVYVVTSKRIYRMWKNGSGKPHVVWSAKYRNTGVQKPGQADAGTGTTPDVMSGGYVSMVDNANPENIVVYRTAAKLHGKKRKVCEVPVFARTPAPPRTR